MWRQGKLEEVGEGEGVDSSCDLLCTILFLLIFYLFQFFSQFFFPFFFRLIKEQAEFCETVAGGLSFTEIVRK